MNMDRTCKLKKDWTRNRKRKGNQNFIPFLAWLGIFGGKGTNTEHNFAAKATKPI